MPRCRSRGACAEPTPRGATDHRFPSWTTMRDNVRSDRHGLRVTVLSVRRVRGVSMAAMKPRTGDGPLEVTKEGRGIVMRVPLEGGGRLVVELTPEEADQLGDALKNVGA